MSEKLATLKELAAKHKRALIIAAAVLAVLIAAAVWATAQLPEDGKIARKVTSGGIDLSGMSVQEAQEVLSGNDFYDNKDFVLISGDEREEVHGADISLAVDAEKSALNAYSVGRGSNWFTNVFDCVKLCFSRKILAPSASVDVEKLDLIIYDMGVRKNGEMKEAEAVAATDTTVTVRPPSAGQSKDVTESRIETLDGIESGLDEIELKLPVSNPGKLTAEQVYAVVYRPSADAEYKLDGKELSIVDEAVGIEADKSEISQKLSALNSGSEISLNVTKLVPEKTAAMLREGLFSAELADYSSTYSTAAANRAFNVARAASSVNGTILLPGDTFSYNAAIGNPSLANGYKLASVYENGQTSEGAGGGVCQVSSTLYSAVLYANLEIVERKSHSLTVAYVPKGQDATVAYGAVDFKFKNNTDHPIRIDASAVKGKCLVKVIGTAPAVVQNVSITHTVAATNEPTVNETNDPTMPAGTRKVTSSGKTGYVIDSVRTVSENGTVVKTEKLTRSTYKMLPTEVSVGTLATPSPAPTAEPSEPAAVVITPEPAPEPSAETQE